MGTRAFFAKACSGYSLSLSRHWIGPEIRLPVIVMIIASMVTAIELAMKAHFYELYKIPGIFIPLITTNCVIIARAEAFASNNSVPHAFVHRLWLTITPWQD